MTLNEIADLRLASQRIATGNYRAPRELTAWMGALQAQDFNMVRWAIGMRVPESTITSVEDAINQGDIIRTHLLRPTWHFVSADDLRWMLGLTGPKIKNGLKYRQDRLGLSRETLSVTNRMIAEMLKGKQLERDEIKAALLKNGIQPGDNRISHIFLWAELSGLICSGKIIKNRQTYALMDERAPAGKNFSKDEMAAMLAKRYFRSHGPATIKDFAWWSGLTVKEIRNAIDMSNDELEMAEADSVKYWYGKDQQYAESGNTARLLPAFDEFIIGYADRSAILTDVHHKKAVSQNGIFRSVVILGNQVAGLWTVQKVKEKLIVGVNPFRSLGKAERSSVETAAEDYGRFMEKKIEVKYI
jgi:hypothetical protein